MTERPQPRAGLLLDLERVLIGRRDAPPPGGSYSAGLVADPVAAQRKIMEEAFELCLELGAASPTAERTAEEAADLVFHVLAGLVGARVPLEAVLAVLAGRFGPVQR